MKKVLSLMMVLMLAFALVACGGGAASSAPASEAGPESTPAGEPASEAEGTDGAEGGLKVALLLGGNVNDQGWNAEANMGLERIAAELGAETIYSEKVDAADFEEVFRGYAELGYDLVVGHGFQFGDAAMAVAPNFPDTFFAVTSTGISQEPNVCSLMNRNDQQGFMAGVVAALETDTGVVGCVGGMEIPSITAYVDGFSMGVEYINELNGTDVKVLSNYTGDFDDAAAAKQLAQAMIDQGADIITHDADAAGLGIFEAVNGAAEGVRCIGAIDDQYEQAPDRMITSAMSKLSGGIFLAAQMLQNGELEAVGYQFGVAEGTVYLADFRDYEVSDENMSVIDDCIAKIESGEIVIEIQTAG